MECFYYNAYLQDTQRILVSLGWALLLHIGIRVLGMKLSEVGGNVNAQLPFNPSHYNCWHLRRKHTFWRKDQVFRLRQKELWHKDPWHKEERNTVSQHKAIT
jgi:hypothetical protein